MYVCTLYVKNLEKCNCLFECSIIKNIYFSVLIVVNFFNYIKINFFNKMVTKSQKINSNKICFCKCYLKYNFLYCYLFLLKYNLFLYLFIIFT